jgi:hypothetical protein
MAGVRIVRSKRSFTSQNRIAWQPPLINQDERLVARIRLRRPKRVPLSQIESKIEKDRNKVGRIGLNPV